MNPKALLILGSRLSNRGASDRAGRTTDLAATFAGQNSRYRPDNNPEVQPHGPIIGISAVVSYTIQIAAIATPADLPEAREPWPACTIFIKFRTISFDFIMHDRARPDNTHLPPQDIDELRQFIKARQS
jgi:hypothetical protein